jgi:hypothetical protein
MASSESTTAILYFVRVPSIFEAVVVYVPEVADELTVVKADHPLQLFPSLDVEYWIIYDLIALVPAAAPLHAS